MMQPQQTVLIVNGNLEDQQSFRRYLEQTGTAAYVYHEARTAADGLHMCRAVRPDMILLDYDLPGENGVTLLTALIEEHGPHTFAAVMVSGVGNEAIAVQAMKAGAQDYLVKDSTLAQRLGVAVATALKNLALHQQVRQQRVDLEHANHLLQQALDSQKEGEWQLRLALQTARMATWEWDLTINHVQWGAGLEEMVGLEPGTFDGTFNMFQAMVHHDDQSRLNSCLDRAIREGAPYEIEFRMLRPDGSVRWTATRGHVVHNEHGEPIRLIGIDMDVTDRKQAEAALHTSERQFKALVEHAPDIIARFDRDLHHLYVSPSIVRVTGFPIESFIGKTNRELGMPEESCALWETHLNHVFATGQPTQFEFTYPIGQITRSYQARIVSEPAENGTVATVMSIARDVTDYKQAEVRLRFLSNASKVLTTSLDSQVTLEQLAHLALPYLGDACIIDVIDAHQNIRALAVAHNDAEQEALLREMRQHYPPMINSTHPVARVLRSGQSLILTDATPEIVANVQHEHLATLIQNLAPMSTLMVPFVMRGKTIGVISLYAVRLTRHYSADDLALVEELGHRATIALDNAKLYQESQEAIREREAFLSIASHEAKNPLTSLLGRAQLLQRRMERRGDQPRDLDDMRVILEQGNRINRLLSDLLNVSRLESGQLAIERSLLDLNALVQRVVAQFQATTTTHVITLTEYDDLLLIAGDASRLEQVLHNLISNAIKYSPVGSTIVVEMNAQEGRASVVVRDQGIGIAADAIPQLFKRFYRVMATSTQDIAGSGIGLYVVKEIMTAHGGSVHVSSTEGVGSTFTIELPLAHA